VLPRNTCEPVAGNHRGHTEKHFIYKMMHRVMNLRFGRYLMRLLACAKSLFRMIKRSVDNVVIRGKTRDKYRPMSRNVTWS